MIMNQKGGVKKIDMGKTDELRLYDMLESAGVIIRVLAWGSLKCFVIEFTLANQDDSEYMDLKITRSGSSGNTFNVPVTKFVLKIIITHPSPDHAINDVYTDDISTKQYSKESEVPEDVGFEVYTQTSAFQNSCTRGRVPVCPSPASMLFFDNADGENFINFLLKKVCGTQSVINRNLSDDRNRMFQVCGYIMRRLQGDVDRGICLVLMPKVGIQGMPQQVAAAMPQQVAAAMPQLVTDPITFNQFMDLTVGDIFMGLPVTTHSRDEVRALLLASVMKLFLAGISHLDLHGGNIMISSTQTGELKINILDLGNSSIFWAEMENRFLIEPSQKELTDLLLGTKGPGVRASGGESLRDRILSVDESDFAEKRHIVTELLDTLQKMDMRGNLRAYPSYHDHDPTRSQMRWWDRIRELGNTSRDRYKYIIGRAFDIVRAEEENAAHATGRSTLTMPMLVELYEEGEINGFDNFLANGDFDIDHYKVVWNNVASQADIMNADISAVYEIAATASRHANNAAGCAQRVAQYGAVPGAAPAAHPAAHFVAQAVAAAQTAANAAQIATHAAQTATAAQTAAQVQTAKTTAQTAANNARAADSQCLTAATNAAAAANPGGGALKQSRRKQSRRKQSRRKQSRRKSKYVKYRAKYSNFKKSKRRRIKK